MHSDCTGVGFLSPQSSKVLISQGEMPNSEKLILKIKNQKNILEDAFRNGAVTKKKKNFRDYLKAVKCSRGFLETSDRFEGPGFQTGELLG